MDIDGKMRRVLFLGLALPAFTAMHIAAARAESAKPLDLSAHQEAQDDEGWEDYESPNIRPEDDDRFKDDNQVDWLRLDTPTPQDKFSDHALPREKALYDEDKANRDPTTSVTTGVPATGN